MKAPRAPRLDERRAAEFAAELQERARAWIPAWGLADGEHDFGRALLEIAARFNSEVAERLDGAGEKMRRGLLDWLAVRGEAARAARMPVVFKLADTAREGVLAAAPVRMQADAGGTPVVFETEKDVRVVPGQLDVVVGIDADNDAFYLPPPGLNDLKPLDPLPTQWQVKSFAAAGVTNFQLDPEAGLLPDTTIEAGGEQYRIVKADKDLVTIDRPLVAGLAEATPVSKVTAFSPFDGRTFNQQQHALYLGDSELLNVEAEATIEVVGAKSLSSVKWEYWGKAGGIDEPGWLTLDPDPDRQKTVNDAVALKKRKGAVELREIEGKNARWIRAYRKTVLSTDEPFANDQVSLRINSSGCPNGSPCPPPDTTATTPAPTSPKAEAMANTTPLVLSQPFYPLGREPRQFDAFYLGSAEAFSKKGADAQVCFEMSDATCLAYAAVRGGVSANKVLAGVGEDHALHLFKLNPADGVMTVFRGSLRPARASQPEPINLNTNCRPVIWNGDTSPDDFFVAVAAGAEIWIWHENASDPRSSVWERHSNIPTLSGAPPADIEDIIVLQSNPRKPGAVLSGGRFWVFNDPVWTHFPTLRNYSALAPIYNANLAATDSMVAVGVDKQLYRLETDGTETAIAAGVLVDVGINIPGSHKVIGVRPAAIVNGTQLRVVAVSDTRDALLGVEKIGVPPGSLKQQIALGAGAEAIGAEIAISKIAGNLQFFVGAKKTSGGALVASWIPTYVTADPTVLFESPIPDASADVRGTPLIVAPHMVVPGARGDAFVAPFDPTQRLLPFTAKIIGDGVILQLPTPFAVNDVISVMPKPAGPRFEWVIVNAPSDRVTETIYVVPQALNNHVANNPELIGYLVSNPANQLAGSIVAASSNLKFNPNPSDPTIQEGDTLRVAEVTGTTLGPVTFCKVKAKTAGGVEIEVEPGNPLPGTSGSIAYWKPKPLDARTVPAIEFNPSGDGNWDVTILERARVYFPSFPAGQMQPSSQQAIAFGVVNNHPTVVALKEPWTSALLPSLSLPTEFIIDGVIGAWKHQLADSSSNPALSWEYWNGKGWWSLELSEDRTQRLAITGTVKFKVPTDIAESDWAGKTNFWIRARLVGGDYGHEEVKVINKPGSNPGETEQVVERSTANIRAPLVLNLHLSYSICVAVVPTFVLAEDSGTVRDQSDANRTPGAIVEAFVSLALTLGRLTKTVASTDAPKPGEDCPPDCDCKTLHPIKAETPSGVTTTAATEPPRVTGREVYIGLAATLSEAPVNVLLLVEERPHNTNFAPMSIEALAADRFVPIVADDATRALGESGVLSMAFAVPPARSELFGKKDLTWLRLIPKHGNDKWLPTLRGAYLNAAWSSATETLTRELLGSSDGAPNLTVFLARPPVLRQTLELRVREPLGEEERDALLKQDAGSVSSTVEGLPGDWVLWKQVIDPDDEPASARVYALDETSGEIRFGDGRHGRIPPIGRDSIVAFSYARTEPDSTGGDSVPGNTIAPRTSLNLVSPVETVEVVTVADHAAGGAPPESDDRVLRFGFARLRHRSRAVTAEDLEDLALQSSPDIVQARAFVRRGFVRLVVVMHGKEPVPNAAQIRELRRLLLAAAPSSLSAPGALRIEGPKIRRLRIELALLLETLDRAGEVSTFVKKKLADFFDTGTGGIDKDGWQLGANPSEEDIALAISDTPYLGAIENVKLHEITQDGNELPSLVTPGSREIVMLADDPIRIQFDTAEVMV